MTLIFEAEVPNPAPQLGAKGCLPIVQFWKDLEEVGDPAELGSRLQAFFYTGLDLDDDGKSDLEPVVSAENYIFGGQVRGNMFVVDLPGGAGKKWQLREWVVGRNTDTSPTFSVGDVSVLRRPPTPRSCHFFPAPREGRRRTCCAPGRLIYKYSALTTGSEEIELAVVIEVEAGVEKCLEARSSSAGSPTSSRSFQNCTIGRQPFAPSCGAGLGTSASKIRRHAVTEWVASRRVNDAVLAAGLERRIDEVDGEAPTRVHALLGVFREIEQLDRIEVRFRPLLHRHGQAVSPVLELGPVRLHHGDSLGRRVDRVRGLGDLSERALE